MLASSFDDARRRDAADPLRSFRDRFHLPQQNGRDVVYLVGNSLGLQPRHVREVLDRELGVWAAQGVEGWFANDQAWYHAHTWAKESLGRLVGAQSAEVVAMNNLTVNLHLLLTSFYRPAGTRTKILIEGGAFPSDQYALETMLQSRGLDPARELVELRPRPGAYLLRTDDILGTIDDLGPTLALVLMGGINYYTGQFFDLAAITRRAQMAGARVGFDLAHAVGNVPLHLHDWGVDFAVWCSYKYLNSGPGGVGGAFVHERHHRADLPRLAGWWGHDEATRFAMKPGFRPMPGADGWQVATPTVLAMAVHRAALDLFDEAGFERLRAKSIALTGYLADLLAGLPDLEILTPSTPAERGCQLSVLVRRNGRALFDALHARGIWGDWREPDVIRLSPVPLYNSFEDVFSAFQALNEELGMRN
jgi:kynureninase